MLVRRALAVIVVALLNLFGMPLQHVDHVAHAVSSGDDPGSVLGVVGRQVAWLNLTAPRPQILTQLQAPAYASDVAMLPATPVAVLAVTEAFPGQVALGGDLMLLDVAARSLSPLVRRSSGVESLGSPAWMPDGSRLFFDRADLAGVPIEHPGQSFAQYPSRIEAVQADGSGRSLIADTARMPAVSPDGTRLTYLRATIEGTALLVSSFGAGEQVLVPSSRFTNLAYPRYSPQGQQIAFMAPGEFVGRADWLSGLIFFPSVGYAHGTPWDLWMVNADGTNLRQVAALGADDAALSWSPDGTHILVYGGNGSALVDAVTGDSNPLSFLAGYGSIAWLPRVQS